MRLPKVLIFSVCSVLLAIYSCSTTNHSPLATQAYNDITSHYNAYFNCNEKLKNTLKVAEQSHKDKFDSVIPVYYYNDKKEFASFASDLDDVVKRTTTAIQLHPTANWTDDHFLLIGEANYLKGDYDKAAKSFKYITTQFKEGVDYVKVMKSLGKKVGKYVRAKKIIVKPQVKTVVNNDGTTTLEKVDNRPAISTWIHTPARSEALVWLIKTYTRQGKYSEADAIVTYVRGDDYFYRDFDPDLNLAEADLWVSKKDYARAIKPLQDYLKADKIKNKKRLVLRPLFVLAQCYQAIGDYGKATENYKKVLKSNPTTEMEFYAKIKMAKMARGNAGSNGEIQALLLKMARDKRYRDYWDQVYYELALIALSEDKKGDARVYLHKSIRTSTTNDEQKAASFLKLAELDYDDEAYVTSKYFYDSTLHFMNKNDVRYKPADERDKVLTNLVKQLTIIAEEDSLQKMASMSREEINQAIEDAIERQKKEAEAKKAAAEAAKQNAATANQGTGGPGGVSQASNWYFYNATTKAQGYNDFIAKWGKRDLEEDWRRSNKATSNSSSDSTAAVSDTAVSKKDTVDKIKGTLADQMYAAIPTTPEKMAKSIDKMVDAYYTAGIIYKDGLEAYDKAREMFETVNTRFPKHKLMLESLYNLYLIAIKQKQDTDAEKYKQQIIANYPESVIAKILKDPNYINEAKSKERALDDYFSKAYSDYAAARYDSAWTKCEMADVLFKPDPYSARFQLLEALILSKENRLSDYVQALNGIIHKSTDAPVKKTATDLLSLLNKSKLPQVDLSRDTAMRDSLNAKYQIQRPVAINAARPDTAELTELQKMQQARDLAAKQGKFIDTGKAKSAVKDTSAKKTAAAAGVSDTAQEDTTGPYKRSDALTHYFIIFIKDPSASQNAIMSIEAKVDAFNSLQFSSKKLQIKQVVIDKTHRLLNVRQFKNKDDVMGYYNVIKTQAQLFSDLTPDQIAITAISTLNFSTLLSNKDIDNYLSFFNRVYSK